MAGINKVIHGDSGFISPKILIASFFGAIIMFVMFMIFTVIIPTESATNDYPVNEVDSIIEYMREDEYREKLGDLEEIEDIDKQFNKDISLKNNHGEETDIIVDIEEEENLFDISVEWEGEGEPLHLN